MYVVLQKSVYRLFVLMICVAIGLSFFIWQNYYQKNNEKLFKILYVEFDQSMQLEKFKKIVDSTGFLYTYNFFKSIYEKNNLSQLKVQTASIIPKIIHIMWLGKKLPAEYEPYVASWRKFHPDWTILFWTDNPINYDRGTEIVHNFDALAARLASVRGGESIVIDATKLDFENRIFYDQATNYGEKSDILKWEIVYRFGGVYVDTDFECLQPLDIFHHTYDFYTGIQPLDTNMVQLGAALYGAIPHHPILEACVKNIKKNQHLTQIIVKTGPIHFTKTFLAVAGTTGLKDIAFPASYFYPMGYEQKGMERTVWCKPESFAVHHWAGSWLKPEAFAKS